MRNALFAALCAAALTAAPAAHAINKCTGADGKVVWQDLPCPGKGEEVHVKPASGAAPAPAAGAALDVQGAATPAAKRKEGVFGKTWQRRTYLENQGVPGTRGQLAAHRRDCKAKIEHLRARQSGANNNLAGAVYLQSLAAEMQATATMCDTRDRELSSQLHDMEKELKELQARP